MAVNAHVFTDEQIQAEVDRVWKALQVLEPSDPSQMTRSNGLFALALSIIAERVSKHVGGTYMHLGSN